MTRVQQHPIRRSCLDCDIDHLFAIRAPVPAVFCVNWESRNRATALVPKEFHALLKNGPIYFDYTKDELIFATSVTLTHFVGLATNVADKRVPQTPEQFEEVTRFSSNIQAIHIRGTIDWSLPDMFVYFWKVKAMFFLKDEYRFEKWAGRLECELDTVPSPLPSIQVLDAFPGRVISRCIRVAQEMAVLEGVKWEGPTPMLLWGHPEKMRLWMDGMGAEGHIY